MPIFLMGALGIYSRIATDDYMPPEYGLGFTEKLEAYIEPVRETQMTIGERRDHPSDHAILKVAETWETAITSGRLKDLPTVHVSDTVQSGVKSQIILARNDTVSALIYLYERRLRRGDYQGAADACRRILTIATVLRHSDLPAITQSVTIQNAALRRLQLLAERDPSIRALPWVQEMEVTATHEVEQVLRHNFRIILAGDGLSESERKHLEPLFKETVVALQGKTSLTTHCPWKESRSFAIALIHANYARIAQQLELQSKLANELRGTRNPNTYVRVASVD